MAYFPMMMDISGMITLVVGGGKVAARKVKSLLDFESKVVVIAPDILEEIKSLKNVSCVEEFFEKQIVENILGREKIILAVVATEDEKTNHQIANELKMLGILTNVVDQKKDCDFIFPSYIKQGELVAAFSSGGQSPVIAQYMKQEAKKYVTRSLSAFSLELGNERENIKNEIASTEERKLYYQKRLDEYKKNL